MVNGKSYKIDPASPLGQVRALLNAAAPAETNGIGTALVFFLDGKPQLLASAVQRTLARCERRSAPLTPEQTEALRVAYAASIAAQG